MERKRKGVKRVMKGKRGILYLLLAGVLCFACAACGKTVQEQEARQKPAESEPSGTEETAVTSERETLPENQVDYEAVYAPVLDEICGVLYNGVSDREEYPYVPSGVIEMARWTDRNELLAAIGYSIRDISGDGVPELLIGTLPDDSPDMESGVVFGGFTCKEQEIVTFLDGWGRNAYQWMGGGEFCNFGSGGAAYAMFGAYQISRDGTELICEDYYFTDIKDENYEEILLYHNTTGVWGRDEAEELSISEEAFWDILKGYEARYQQPDLTPFSAYEYTGYIAQSPDSKVRLDYLEDVAYMLAQYDDASEYLGGFYPPDTEFETTVVFRAEEEIKDFRLLSLSLRDVDDSGHATFDMTEVFRIPVLRPDTPLAVPMSFPGDIPSNGFGYTEADGTLRQFTVGMSGKDGSLEVSPMD